MPDCACAVAEVVNNANATPTTISDVPLERHAAPFALVRPCQFKMSPLNYRCEHGAKDAVLAMCFRYLQPILIDGLAVSWRSPFP